MAFDDVINDLANRGSGTAIPAGVTSIGGVAVDASMQQVHSAAGEATEFPVEEGSDISDNYKMKPRRFRITGLITNQPINLPGSQVEGVTEVQSEFKWEANPSVLGLEIGGPGLIGIALGAVASATGINEHTGTAKSYSPEFDRVQDARDIWDGIMEAGTLFDIYTTRRVYHNMVIETFDDDRDAEFGSALRFTMVTKQIRVVTSQFSAVEPLSLVERGKPQKSRGKQSAKDLATGSAAGGAADSAASEVGQEKTSVFLSAFL